MNQNNKTDAMRFSVRFNGELLPGFTKEAVIVSIAKAYEVEPAEISKWFTDEGVTLREEATSEELAEIEGFFKQHGLRLEIINLNHESKDIEPDIEPDLKPDLKPKRDEEDVDFRHDDFGQETKIPDRHEIALEDLQKTLTQLNVLMSPKELEGFVPASLVKRTVAFILDYFIMSFLSLVLIYILGSIGLIDITPFREYLALAESTLSVEDLMANSELQPILEEMILSFSIWVSFTFIFYFGMLERFYGATLGKKVFNIRVYSVRTGSQLGWNTVLIRTILFYLGINFLPAIPFIGGLLFLASVLWATRDPFFKRTLYDNLSGTVVGSIGNKS